MDINRILGKTSLEKARFLLGIARIMPLYGQKSKIFKHSCEKFRSMISLHGNNVQTPPKSTTSLVYFSKVNMPDFFKVERVKTMSGPMPEGGEV